MIPTGSRILNFIPTMQHERVIDTGRSFLSLSTYPNRDLLNQCVEAAKPFLHHKPTIVVYGKHAHQRRNVGFFSDESRGYRYSHTLMPSQPLPEALRRLLADINQQFGAAFNGILVNEYQDGNDYIGAHSDDESGLDARAGVIAISVGATRKFRIRKKPADYTMAGERVMDILTTDSQVMQMGGDFQREFKHEIPAEKKVKEARVSFTFRRHVE